jgi:hypothetical protein
LALKANAPGSPSLPSRPTIVQPVRIWASWVTSGLAIAGADAHGVQFEDFARQILVQAAFAILPGFRIGPDGLRIVEEIEHAGMLFDRSQHVGETAGDIGADGFAFEDAGAGAPDIALGDRDAEMIRPEGDQALDKADRRHTGAGEARRRLGAEDQLLGRRGGCHHRWIGRRSETRRSHGDRRHDGRRGERDHARRRLDQARNARRGHAQSRHSLTRDAIALLFFAILIVVNLLKQERGALQSWVVGALRRVQFCEDGFARIAGPGKIARTGSKTESVERDEQARIGKHGSPSIAPQRAPYKHPNRDQKVN